MNRRRRFGVNPWQFQNRFLMLATISDEKREDCHYCDYEGVLDVGCTREDPGEKLLKFFCDWLGV